MATLSECKLLIKFSRDTKDFNPNMYKDIRKGIYVPCKALNEHIDRYYKLKEEKMLRIRRSNLSKVIDCTMCSREELSVVFDTYIEAGYTIEFI